MSKPTAKEVIEELMKIVKDGNADADCRIKAAALILDFTDGDGPGSILDRARAEETNGR